MPSSHGGGHGGGHSSGTHSSSNRVSYSRTTPFVGCRRYRYINRYGDYAYFYSSKVPRKMSLGEVLIGPIIFVIILLAIIGFSLNEVIPRKLPANNCIQAAYLQDNAEVLVESDILPVLKEFHEKTGVQPCIYTCIKDEPVLEYQVENLAYNTYLHLFDDEGHFLIYYVEYGEDNFIWCDMSGDNTNHVVTDKFFELFQESLQTGLENKSISTTQAFVNAFTYANEIVLTSSTIDYSNLVGTGVFLLIFSIIIVISIKSTYQQYKDNNEYCEYRETKNGGVDDVSDVDMDEILKKKSTTSDEYENMD